MGRQKKAASKTFQVVLSSNALQNIDEITGYIAFIKQQPSNAIKVGDSIFDMFDRIQLNPYVFRECDELPTASKMYRRVNCLSWQIIYKVTDVEILILGIIHRSRKPSKIKALRVIRK